MYYRIKSTLSIAYLNDKDFVNNELNTLDTYIRNIKNQLGNNDKEILKSTPIYKISSNIGKKNIEEKYYKLAIYQL